MKVKKKESSSDWKIKKNCQLWVLYLAKISFRNEGEKLRLRRLRECVSTTPTLEEWPKEALQTESMIRGGDWELQKGKKDKQLEKQNSTDYPLMNFLNYIWNSKKKNKTTPITQSEVVLDMCSKHAQSLQSCLTSFRPHGLQPTRLPCPRILQAGILEWVAISFSKGSSRSSDQTPISCLGRRVL